MVRHLEKEGRGLNLCYEVEDGIVCHTGKKKADTLEGRIIHYADRIAYINHDIDDSIRAGILTEEDIPAEVTQVLGRGHGKRIDAMVKGMIAFGERTGGVGMERDCETAMLTCASLCSTMSIPTRWPRGRRARRRTFCSGCMTIFTAIRINFPVTIWR